MRYVEKMSQYLLFYDIFKHGLSKPSTLQQEILLVRSQREVLVTSIGPIQRSIHGDGCWLHRLTLWHHTMITNDWTFCSRRKHVTQFTPRAPKRKRPKTFAVMCSILSHGKTNVCLCVLDVSEWGLYVVLLVNVMQVGEPETADCECGKTLVNSREMVCDKMWFLHFRCENVQPWAWHFQILTHPYRY